MRVDVWREEPNLHIIALREGRKVLTMQVTDQELEMSQDPRAYLANALERLINQWNLQQPIKVPAWWAKRVIEAPFDVYEDEDATGDRSGSNDRVLSNERQLPGNSVADEHPINVNRVG
jgi:hypothetical protein